MSDDVKIIGGMAVPGERVVERGRGCWNCTAFDSGPRTLERFHALRIAEIRANPDRLAPPQGSVPVAARAGRNDPCPCGSNRKYKLCCLHLAEADALARAVVGREEARLAAVGRLIAAGRVGTCGKGPRPKDAGGPEGDFVEFGFLCDRWNGKTGSSGATDGRKLDDLPGELKEKLGDPT